MRRLFTALRRLAAVERRTESLPELERKTDAISSDLGATRARIDRLDIGCIAHRAGLAEARFDESLIEMGDWDLFLRLTRHRPPLALPAVACFYTTDAPNRLSYGATHDADETTVRAKNRR